MTVYLNSRYAGEKIARVRAADGERRPTIFRRPPPDWEFDYDEHIVVDGDRIDLIAAQAYGNSDTWWVIMEANPEIDVPEPLVPGTRLRIPRAD